MRRTPLKRGKPLARKPLKPKKPAAKSEKWFRNQCDIIAREICLLTAENKCAARNLDHPKSPQCSLDAPMQWCHLKSRRFVRLRHDPENSVCMCAAHHRFTTDHPDVFRDLIEGLYPGRWQSLNEKLCEDVKVRYRWVYEGLVEVRNQIREAA